MASLYEIMWGMSVLGGVCWWICVISEAYTWFMLRLSYHASIRHVIRTLQRLRKNRPLKELSTLAVHVVSKVPLFKAEPWWEIFMSGIQLTGIPNINKVNLVFIVQGKEPFRQPFDSTEFNMRKLSEGRTVTFVMKQMLYHMYFSSKEYIEPDAVLIYENVSAMLGSEEDTIHSEISYRNMISKKNTVLVLLDSTKELLDQGVSAVNAIRPVDQPVLHNLQRGQYMSAQFSRYRFTCLRRK